MRSPDQNSLYQKYILLKLFKTIFNLFIMSKSKRMNMEILNPNAAGIDIGSRSHYTAIGQGSDQVKEFGVYAEDHLALIDWLNESEITTVAMESTGNYWQNLFTALQNAGFEVLLANGKFTKNIKGKKQMYSIVNGYKNYIQSTC